MKKPQPLSRRRALQGVASAAIAPALWFTAPQATAQTARFPQKGLRIVVPFGAGGVADLTARTVGQRLSTALGQPVVIENRPGAGGIAAGEAVARAEPDGHTLLLMSNATAVSEGLFKTMPFNALKDFAPISLLGSFDLAVVTAEGGRFKTIAELLAFAKANPGQLNVGTINIGSTQNLAAELVKTSAQVDFQVVPFNGSPAVITALRGGQIDAAVEILGPTLGQISGGALRALAVMGERRAAVLPNVPTLTESGVRGFNVTSWNALAAPARTPKDVIDRLQREVQAALTAPDVKQKLEELNVTPSPSTPEQLGQWLAAETKRWGDVIARAKIPQQ
jgi:tripartite-type tricarboxylate transporter receptor subunit TctC